MIDEKKPWRPINRFKSRLEKLGIHVELAGNLPWIYMEEVNGHRVRERYGGNHGFTAFTFAVRLDGRTRFTNAGVVFNKIREYIGWRYYLITRPMHILKNLEFNFWNRIGWRFYDRSDDEYVNYN